MTSYCEKTYRTLYHIADQDATVRRTCGPWPFKDGKKTSLRYYRGSSTYLSAGWTGYWRVEGLTPLSMMLEASAKVGEANELTTLCLWPVSKTDWKPIAPEAGISFPGWMTAACKWVEDQCLTWLASPDARAHSGSGCYKFATTVLGYVLSSSAVGRKWTDAPQREVVFHKQSVTLSLRPEKKQQYRTKLYYPSTADFQWYVNSMGLAS